MQELADKHESDIQAILKDTADRVNAFKEQLEDQRDEQRVLKITKVVGEANDITLPSKKQHGFIMNPHACSQIRC